MNTTHTELIRLFYSARDLQMRTRDTSDIAGHWSVDGHMCRVDVAVVDTGFDRESIMLANTLSTGSGHVTTPGLFGGMLVQQVTDTNERPVVQWIDDQQRRMCYLETSLSSHGTHVAGIVALVVGGALKEHYRIEPKAIGVAGCSVASPRQLEQGCETQNPYNQPGHNVVAALRDLATAPAYANVKVVNLSWGFDFTNHDLRDALLDLMNSPDGKLVVVSAGNDNKVLSDNANLQALVQLAHLSRGRLVIVGATQAYVQGRPLFWDFRTGTPVYSNPRPRSHSESYFGTPGVCRAVTQSAPDAYAGEGIAPYSNYPGPNSPTQSVFICAPGSDILSTVPRANQIDGVGVAPESGTSMAAPVVSGLLAKALICFPSLTVDEVRHLLFATADKDRLYSKEQASQRPADRAYETPSVGGYAAFSSPPPAPSPQLAQPSECGVGLVNADRFRLRASILNDQKKAVPTAPKLAPFSVLKRFG